MRKVHLRVDVDKLLTYRCIIGTTISGASQFPNMPYLYALFESGCRARNRIVVTPIEDDTGPGKPRKLLDDYVYEAQARVLVQDDEVWARLVGEGEKGMIKLITQGKVHISGDWAMLGKVLLGNNKGFSYACLSCFVLGLLTKTLQQKTVFPTLVLFCVGFCWFFLVVCSVSR